jgi:hypothetical protein
MSFKIVGGTNQHEHTYKYVAIGAANRNRESNTFCRESASRDLFALYQRYAQKPRPCIKPHRIQ